MLLFVENYLVKDYAASNQMLYSDAELMHAAEFDADFTVMAGKKNSMSDRGIK